MDKRKRGYGGQSAVPHKKGHSTRRKKKRRRRYFYSGIILILLILAFLVSGTTILRTLIRYRAEDKYFEELSRRAAETVIVPETKRVSGKQQEEPEQPSPLEILYSENNDLYGWIKIEGTRIDYPVMYTPDDPEYYIDHNFDGKKTKSGVPFIGEGFSESGMHTIIYGHNMKNGTMFAALTDYSRNEFFQEHPIIEFDTLEGTGQYEIISAFYSRVYYQNETNVFRYYNYTDLSDEGTFEEYISKAKAASMFDTGVTAEYGDEILTLSTCSYNTANGRFVVIARKITEEDK